MTRFRCKGCTDRKTGCHSYCLKYKEDKEAYNKIKDIERKVRYIDDYIASSIIEKKEWNRNSGRDMGFSNSYPYYKSK